MRDASSLEPPLQRDSVLSHPRVLALSKPARRIYGYLCAHSSDDGTVVAMRVEHWLPGSAVEVGEIVDAWLLGVDGEDQYYVVLPRTLDEAEQLASGGVG